MSKNPLVTIAIPVYNGEKEICEAIASVLNQTYTNFELLVLDDCSTDLTLEQVGTFDDVRIRVVESSHNLGYSGNFNRAVEMASGKYLKILCHDDVIKPQCLELQVRCFEQDLNETIALCSGRKNVVNPLRKNVFPSQGYGGRSRRINGLVAVRKCVRSGRNLIGETSVALVRTDLIRNIGSFQTKYTLDLNMWFRLLRNNDFYYINEVVSEFRILKTSGTAHQSKTQAAQTIALSEWAQSLFGNLSTFDLLVGRYRARINQIIRRAIFYIFA